MAETWRRRLRAVRVVVHAGMAKTGSSAVQHYLHTHRERLRAARVMYPDFGHRTHWMLAAAFAGNGEGASGAFKRIEKGLSPYSVDEFREVLRAEVRNAPADHLLILSDERMSRGMRAKRLVEFLHEERPDAEIDVAAYIRNPLAHFPSAVQQKLKAEGDNTMFPATWLSQHCVEGLCLQFALPRPPVLRVFDSSVLVNRDVVDDFREVVRTITGFALPENEDKSPRNVSHSAAGCAVLALRDLAPAVPFPVEHRKQFFRQIRATEEQMPGSRLALPDDFRATIAANHHEAWNALVDVAAHDAATRARLKITPEPMPPATDPANTARWALRGLSEDYVHALLARFRGMTRNPAGASLAAWLEGAVRATAPLHGLAL